MRILIVHQNFVDHQHPGGTRHLELATHLSQLGYEITILTSNLDYLTGKPVVETHWGVAEEFIGNVQILRAWTISTLHRSLAWRVLSYLVFMMTSVWAGLRSGRADVVIGTSPPIFQLPSAYLLSLMKRAMFMSV